MGSGRLQRPADAHLEDPHPDLGGHRRIDAQILKGLQDIQIGLARGDDAKPGLGAVHDDAIKPVGSGKRPRRAQLVLAEPHFLLQRLVRPAGVQTAWRQGKVLWQLGANPVRVNAGDHGGIRRFGDGLQPHPATAVAGQGPAEHAEVKHFLNIGRVEYRHRGSDEDVLRLMRQGGRLAGVVVPGDCQHPAVPGGAAGVGVAEGIDAAVHPRPLAVPHAEHAIELGFGVEFDLLASGNRRGG